MQIGDGANYQVVVTNAAGSVTSVVATLTVLVPPAITGQPQNRTNIAGTTASFSVTATGSTPLRYQWCKDGVNLAEGGNVSGATSSSLTLVNVQPVDAANYQVVVTNAAGAVTSTVARLTVLVPPAITAQPQSRTNVAGTTATFTVTASGGAPLNYQWLKNGANLVNGGNVSGANGPTLSLSNVQLGDVANYQVIVANTAASATSAVATLTVLVPPAITGHPQSQTNIAGTTATFSVTATGTTPLSYQWRKQGIGLPGATAATLTLTGVQPADAADYTVVVTNVAGSVTSAVARLTVIVPPTISAQPQSHTNLAGTTATFSVTASGDPPPNYQWLKNGANMVNGGNVSGADGPTVSLANVQLGDGANYQAVVANAAGSTTSVVAKLTVVIPPEITVQPPSRTNAPGTLAIFSVTATGTEPLSYQWRFNGANLAVANSSTYNINSVQSVNAGLYTVVVTNAYGSVTSAPASLVIQAYCVSAQVAAEAYPIGTAVPVQVRTRDCANTNAAVPNVPAVVWIRTQGTSRSISLVTDGFGQATVYFQPLASEAGAYEVAAGIGSEVNAPAQDTFALVGMSLTPSQASHRLKVGVPESGSAALLNLSAVPLTGLSVTVESQPGNVTVQSGAPASLGGNATGQLSYTLTATGDSPAQGTVILRVNSAQGVSVRLTLNLEVASAAPSLVATPSPLNAAMLRGGQALVSFEVANVGGTASGDLDVRLPGVPWLALVSPSPIASLAPGQTNTVTLTLTPSNTLALGPYPGSIVLQGGTTNLTVPFEFNCVSSLKGGLRVTVVDEFTYFVSGAPKVTNATVTLADPYTGTNLASAATDASGEVLFTNLTEAYYEVTVQADKHGTFKTTLLVPADQTFELRAFLPREMVSYRWQVTPTSVPDRYEFVLDTTFETYVPIPVVTVEPGAIDLCAIPGDTSQINLVITNHGLMAAKAARLGFANHALWEITPLVENLGDIAARSSVVVPVIVRRLPAATNAPSQIEAHVDWQLVTADGPLYYRVPIYVYNAGLNDCAPGSTGSVPFAPPGGGGGGGGGSGGGSAEAPFVTPPPAFAPPDTDIVRVTVGLQLKQSAVMSRNGFEAALELINNAGVPLTGLSVMLDIRDAAKEPAAHLFGVRPPELSGLNAVDGSGLLNSGATGRATWTLIPATNAAPIGPTPYTIGGELVYVLDGQTVHIPLFPVPITVLPDPRLVVDYFWERDVFSDDPFTPQVEPAVPFGVGLRMKNVGLGTAGAVTITSAQPQIVRNDSGLLIDFKLIGAQVGNQPFTPSLTANLGDIGPSNSAVATWWMTSTLEGRFIEYDATFQHVDDLGNQNLSLIDSVTIHEMIHVVRAELPSDDGIPDFLVNEDRDTNGLPDHLYLSDGSVALVTAVTNAAPSGAPTPGNPDVLLAASLPAGWAYLRIPDPGNAAYPLSRVRRSDGRELLLGTNAWLTHRVVRASGQANRVENRLHLVDYNSTGFYTVSYGVVVLPPVITSQPQSRTNIAGTTATFGVTATSAEPLYYQWRRNGTNLLNAGNVSGATSATLTLGNVQPADASLYQVVVSNAGGSVTSIVATLTVWVPPTITGITVEPQRIIPGTTVTFNVSATGDTPLNYQWRKNGANLLNGGNVSGANSATLVLANAQTGDAGNYQVVVTNIAGAVTSAVVTLTLVLPPTITVQPQSRTNLLGTTATFNVTASGTEPLSYQWRFNGLNLADGARISGAA
ncbi:MAG: immunoglobulin domain-containing protein, partial [Verrucomicrobia bacterium]|nr:immunoglobulin domain-containing protein [Verrucomicrobiota bacterium]